MLQALLPQLQKRAPQNTPKKPDFSPAPALKFNSPAGGPARNEKGTVRRRGRVFTPRFTHSIRCLGLTSIPWKALRRQEDV